MIQVKVKYQDKIIKYLEVYGHANAADYGNDIVCAGVSSILLSNLMYAEKQQLGVFETKQQDGHVIVNVIESDDYLNHILAATVDGLQLIKEQYPEYIKMKIWR